MEVSWQIIFGGCFAKLGRSSWRSSLNPNQLQRENKLLSWMFFWRPGKDFIAIFATGQFFSLVPAPTTPEPSTKCLLWGQVSQVMFRNRVLRWKWLTTLSEPDSKRADSLLLSPQNRSRLTTSTVKLYLKTLKPPTLPSLLQLSSHTSLKERAISVLVLVSTQLWTYKTSLSRCKQFWGKFLSVYCEVQTLVLLRGSTLCADRWLVGWSLGSGNSF